MENEYARSFFESIRQINEEYKENIREGLTLIRELSRPQASYSSILASFALGVLSRTVTEYMAESKEEEKKTESISYRTMDDGLKTYYKNCSICCDDFDDTSEIVITDCNHCYHQSCIEEWFKRKTNCPICRKDL